MSLVIDLILVAAIVVLLIDRICLSAWLTSRDLDEQAIERRTLKWAMSLDAETGEQLIRRFRNKALTGDGDDAGTL